MKRLPRLLFAVGLVVLSLYLSYCGDNGGAGPSNDKTPPTVLITYPPDGSSVSNAVTVNVTTEAIDNIKVEEVDFYIDGQMYFSDTLEPWICGWVTSGLADQSEHTIYAKAYDNARNYGISTIISVIIDYQIADNVSPAKVNDLMVIDSGEYKFKLIWTAPGDDGIFGKASYYDFRYHTSLINTDNWDSAIELCAEPIPGDPGNIDSFFIGELGQDTIFYCALKTVDEASNYSDISNNIIAPGTKVYFVAGQEYEVGDNPSSVFLGDLNGDTKTDIAVTNFSSNTITVMINDGFGLFPSGIMYDVGQWPSSVFGKDINMDNHLDLVVANRKSNNVSVLINNGSGLFSTAQNYQVGSGPLSVYVADLNDDHANDIVTANEVSNNITVLINNLDGTFRLSGTYGGHSVGNDPFSLFVSDFDLDGDNDLVVANAYHNNITIFSNDSNGMSFTATNYSAGEYTRSVFAADFNNDGYYDIAAANELSQDISIFMNTGNGDFLLSYSCSIRISPFAIYAAHIDEDNYIDIVTANRDADRISVLINRGNGVFDYVGNYMVGDSPVYCGLADIDGDIDNDLVVVNSGSDNISILINPRN